MSHETDNLKREIDHLKWQKAENYKLESLESTVRHLKELIIILQNENSYFREGLNTIEQRINAIPLTNQD